MTEHDVGLGQRVLTGGDVQVSAAKSRCPDFEQDIGWSHDLIGSVEHGDSGLAIPHYPTIGHCFSSSVSFIPS
jgi:hypothetical protein